MQYEMQLMETQTQIRADVKNNEKKGTDNPFMYQIRRASRFQIQFRFLFLALFVLVLLMFAVNSNIYAGNPTKNVNVKTSNTSMGSVNCSPKTGNLSSGDGVYYSVQQSSAFTVTVTATATSGYKFVKWNDGNTTTPRTISIPQGSEDAEYTYTAEFAPIQYTLTVNVASEQSAMGNVSGGGTYDYNSSQTITATANEGYHFVRWNDGNTDATRSVTIPLNGATYIAEFAPNQYTLTVNVKSGQSAMGSVSGGGTYDYNTSHTITATPNTGYHFVKWNDGNTSASRSVNIPVGGTTYTAEFAANVYVFTLDAQGGTPATSSFNLAYNGQFGSNLTTPTKTGYAFGGWYTGTGGSGTKIEASTVNTFTQNTTLYAKWTCNASAVSFSVAASQNNFCDGGQTTLTTTLTGDFPSDATKNYAWKRDETTIPGTGATNTVTPPSGTNNYSVTLTLSYDNTCSTTKPANVSVTVNPIPAAPTVTGDTRCGSGEVTMSVSSPTSGYSYKWYDGSGTLKNTGNSYNPTITGTTHYYVSSVSDKGCESSQRTDVTATVNPVPAVPSVTPGSNCGPGTVSLSATVGTDGTTCKWYDSNTGAAVVATGTSYSPNLNSTQTYYVSSYNVTTTCESSRASVTATIKTIPTVAVDPTSVTVGRTSTGTTTTTLTASGATSYSWYKDALSVGSGENFTTPNDLSEGEHTYQVVGTTDGCSKTATATVTVVMPAVTLNEINASPAVLCKNESSILTATASSSKGTVDWSWISSSGSNYSGYQITVTPDVTTTYTVTATARAASVTATATKTVTITVKPRPSAPTLTGVTRAADTFIVCNSNSITLTANPGADNTCRWYDAGGTVKFNGNSYTINSLSPGIYDYNVYAVNSANCESEDATHAVAVIGANPTISNVNHTDIRCHGANDGKIEVEASQTPPGNQLLYTRSNWFDYRTDGNFEGLEAGTYTIKVKDNFGCETSTSEITIVNPDALTLTVSGSKDQQKCAGNAIDNITFNSNGTMTATVLPAGLSFNSLTGVLSGEPTATGDNSYTITATNANNCDPLTITGTITKYSLPNVTVTADASTLGRWPSPDTRGATQTTLRASGASTYTWYKASENLGTGSTYTTPSTLTDGTYTYKVIGTDAHSCSNTATTTVTVVTPAVTLSDITATETVLCHQGSTELTTSTQSYTGTSEVSYSWSGTGLTSTTGATVSASQLGNTTTAPITNTYTVTATATAGSGANAATATATKSIDIKVYPKVVMNPLRNDTVVCRKKAIPAIKFSSTLPADSMTYTWSIKTSSTKVKIYYSANHDIPLPDDSTGNFPKSYVTNSAANIQTITVSVVPHYGKGSLKCDGDTVKYKITVYPKITPKPSITSDTMCSGSSMIVSFGTNVTQAGTSTYDWIRKNENIIGTDFPANIKQTNKTSINASNISTSQNTTQLDTITVTQKFTATGYDVTCPGTANIYIQVYPNPGMNVISPSDDQYICHDGTMNEVTLSSRISSAYMKYEWTRTNTENVGGLRDGTVTGSVGKIKDSVLTNISNSEQTTAVSVRPIYTSSSNKVCRGSDDSVKTFKIHVSPKAVMTDLSSHTQTLCHGEALSTVTFGTNIDPSGNVQYKWTRTNTDNIGGIDASCESNCTGISSDAVTNTTNTAQVTTITVTPKYYSSNFSSCNWETSSDRTFTITVNPETKMTATPNSDVISHDSLLTVTFNTNITDGTRTFHWKRDNNAVSQWEMEGTDNISVYPENTTSTPQVVNVKAWLSYTNTSGGESCTTSSDTVSFSITVNPRVTMNITAPANPNQTICSGNQIDAVRFGTDLTIDADKTIEYNWTRTTVSGVSGLEGPGQGDISATAMSNSSGNQATTTFTVTPRYTANGITVDGEPVQFNITLKVAPTVSITQPAAICSGDTISSTETINDHGGTLSVSKWQKKHGDTWSDFILSTPLNNDNDGDILRYTVTNECGSNNSNEETITVYQSPATPTIDITQGAEDMCYGDDLSLTATSTGAGSFVWSGEDIGEISGLFDNCSAQHYSYQRGAAYGTVNFSDTGTMVIHSNQPENDMQIRWNFDGLNPADYKYVQIRYKTIGQTPGVFRVCVRTENQTSLQPFTSVAFINDDQWHVMTINASGSAKWTDYGGVTGIRIDIRGTSSAVDVLFDHVAVLKSVNPLEITSPSEGEHTYYVTQVSGQGCGASEAASQTINVHKITVNGITASQDALCGGGEDTLTANVSSTTDEPETLNYVWKNGIGAEVGNTNPITVSPSENTTYTVSASVPDVGCTATATKTVNVHPALNPGAVSSGSKIVARNTSTGSVTVSNTTPASGGQGTITYQWKYRKNNGNWQNVTSNGTGQNLTFNINTYSGSNGTYEFTRWAINASCAPDGEMAVGQYTLTVGDTIRLDSSVVVTRIDCWGGGGSGGRRSTDNGQRRGGTGGGGGGYAALKPINNESYIPYTVIPYDVTLIVTSAARQTNTASQGNPSTVSFTRGTTTLYTVTASGGGAGSSGTTPASGGTATISATTTQIPTGYRVTNTGGTGGTGTSTSSGSGQSRTYYYYGGGGGGAAGPSITNAINGKSATKSGNTGSAGSGGTGYCTIDGNSGAGATGQANSTSAAIGSAYGGGGGGRGGNSGNVYGAAGIVVVTLKTVPSASITQPSAICENTSLSITPTISWGDGTQQSQKWQISSGTTASDFGDISNLNNIPYSYNNRYIRLAVTTEYGTRYSNAVQISVKQKQHPLFDLSKEYCPSNQAIALSEFANNSDGIHEGGIRGSWATTAAPSTPITSLPGDNPGASDLSYSIKFTHNNDYCAFDTTFTITVWAKPSVSLSSNKDQTVCQGTSVGNITITANNANAAASWSFNKGGDNSSLTRNGQTISGMMANAGTFNYSVTVGSAHSCTHTATASGTITVTPYNTITLTSASTTDNQTICKGSNIVTITYSTTGATDATFSGLPTGVSGLWSNNVATISGTPTEGGTFTYTVTMTGGCTGVTNTATGTITVNDPQITLQALRDTTVCSGNQVKMEAVVTAHQSDNITYAWYKDGGTTAYKTVSSFTEAYNTTTSYRLVATALKTMNGKQCSVSDEKSATITITNPAVTNLTITANPASICYEDSSTLTASCNYTGGSISYSWTGAGLGQTSGAVVKAGATGTAGSTTEYTVTATATSGSCTATDTHTVTVTVNPKVVMNTPSPVNICHNEGVNIPFSNSGTGLVEADMRYTWTSSNANVGGLTPGTVTSTGIVASALTNTTTQPQTTTIEVTPKYLHNGIECTGTPVNFTITVKPEVKMNEPVVSPNTTICHEGSISMTFSPSLTGGTTTYSWTRNNTDVVGGADHGNGNIVNLTLTNTNSTFKQTTFKVTPIFEGCTATASGQREITVSVNPKVVMDTPSDTRICHNDNLNVNFTTSMTGGETTYSWTRNNTTSVGGTASGNGDISGLKLTNTTNQAQVTTFEVTPTYKHNDVSCTGTPITFNVTVNPQVKMKHVADQTLCHNTSSTAVTLTSLITDGTVSYSWYRDNTTNITGLVNSGTSSTLAAATALNNTATVQTTTYRITPTYTNGISCTMTGDSTFKITVYPSVSLAQVDAQYVSHDSIKKIQLQSGNSTDGSISYTWNRTSVANVTGSENGSGNTLSDLMQIKLSNTNNEPKTVTFTVTPTYHNNGKDCQGAAMSFNVTVNPKVTMKITAPTNPNQTICSGDNIEQVTFGTELSLNTERTIVYNWTRTSESGVSGLEGPGQGNIAATAMSNSNSEPKTVTFTVTPRYTANSITIDGETKTFTITVNPEVKMNPISDKTLCNGEGLNVEFGTTLAVGTTSYAWARNNTDVVGGTDHGNGNIENLILTNSNTIYKTTTFTVTPTFTYGGKTCTATQTNEQQFTVTVNPTVQMATPANDTICHNEQLNVAFSTSYTGGTVTYAWSRDNNSVGGTTSGNGNISNLTLTNTTNSPQTTEFTVTPTYTNGASCTGTVVKFKVTVNPQVKMNHVADQTLCHGDNMTAVNFASALTSANTRMSYAWNRDNTGNVTGLAGNGNGNIASTQFSNITTADQTTQFTVKPTYTFGKACTMTGDNTFKIVVNPKVIMVTPADVTMCNDSLLNVTFQSNLTPGTTTYSWTREGSDVTGTASGSGNIQNLKLTNNTTSAKTTTFTVTPTYTSNGKACTDENAQFVVTVYPRVQMDAIGNQHKCSGEDIAAVNFVHHITDGNVTFEWTRDNANVQGLGGLTGAVTADHIDVTTVTNTTNLPQVTTIMVTPIYQNGTTVCRGEQRSFTITVNPEVKMDAVNAQSVCDGSMLEVEFGTQLSGGTMSYSWTRTNENITGIGGLTTPVNGNISATISNSTLEAQTSTFRVIPTFTYNGVACTATQSNYRTFDVTVNKNPATPTLSSTADVVCYTTSVTYTATSTHTEAGGFRWTVDETVVSGNTSGTYNFNSPSVGNHTIKVEQVSSHGCGTSSPATKTLQVKDLQPGAITNGSMESYLCGSYTISNVTAAKCTSEDDIDYKWTCNGTDIPNTNMSSLTEAQYPLNTAGTFVFKRWARTTCDACTGSTWGEATGSYTITVKHTNPGSIASNVSSMYPCQNFSISNTAAAECLAGQTPVYQWTYTKNDGTATLIDVPNTTTAITQEELPLNEPGIYVITRSAKTTCTEEDWQAAVSVTITVNTVGVEPGDITPRSGARTICANTDYSISNVTSAHSLVDGQELHYKWDCEKIINGVTTKYKADAFNSVQEAELIVNANSHPECLIDTTGLFIIRRYSWAGCSEAGIESAASEYKIAVIAPEQAIPGAMVSNYYEICTGGKVTLTEDRSMATIVLPKYDNPEENETLEPYTVKFQSSYDSITPIDPPYSTNVIPLELINGYGSGPEAQYMRAQFHYSLVGGCYAYSEYSKIVIQNDPVYNWDYIVNPDPYTENAVCPNGEVIMTAPTFTSTITGEDKPYYYTWKIVRDDYMGFDTVGSEAYYSYEDNGRIVHVTNFVRTLNLNYDVIAENELGCNVDYYTYNYYSPITANVSPTDPVVLTETLDRHYCPSNTDSVDFSTTIAQSMGTLIWYSDSLTTTSRETPVVSRATEQVFRFFVSQNDGACESARISDSVVIRYTSHIAHNSGALNQTLPQKSRFTPSPVEAITFDYSNYYADGDAVPVATGLPSGVSGVANNGVFTISGEPTQAGTFNYTVRLQGGECPQPTEFTGRLTVYPTYDTIVYFTSCGAENFIVQDSRGHSYTVNTVGTHVFGNAQNPLKTVNNTDSIVTVVYTNSLWYQFGFEEGTKTIASWTAFSSVSSGIYADDGNYRNSSQILYEGWGSNSVVNNQSNIGQSTTCAVASGKSLGLRNYESGSGMNNNKSIVIKTSTKNFGYLNFAFDYTAGKVSNYDISYSKIDVAYSLDGSIYKALQPLSIEYPESLGGSTSGSFSFGLSDVENGVLEDKTEVYLRFTFSGAAYTTAFVGPQYFVMDNICLSGVKAITELTAEVDEDTVCTNGEVYLRATPPYINTEGETPVVTPITYTWERIVDGTSVVFEEGDNYMVSDEQIPVGEYKYVVRVGHDACLLSDTVVMLGVTPTYDTNNVKHASVCSNNVDRLDMYDFTDTVFVPGMAIRRPGIEELRVPGLHHCWLNIPDEDNLCGERIVGLDLEVKKAFDTTITESICLGSTYDKYGIHYEPISTGDITLYSPESWTCSTGCDSIYRVTLTVSSVKQEITSEYGITLVAWDMNTGLKSFVPSCGRLATTAKFNVVGAAPFANVEGHNPSSELCFSESSEGALQWPNLYSKCTPLLGGSVSYESYEGAYFEIKIEPKNYNNLKLQFDYLRNNAESDNARAFDKVNYSYRLPGESEYTSVGSVQINNTEWSTATLDWQSVNTLEEDVIYLKVEFTGGSRGSTVSCGAIGTGGKYLPSYITVDNVVITGDKPTRKFLSPCAVVGETEFCEGGTATFVAQTDTAYFNKQYFDFYLINDVDTTRRKFVRDTMTIIPPLPANYSITAFDRELQCDSVLATYLIQLNRTAHIAEDSVDNKLTAPVVCSGAHFSFVPQDGVHGEVPPTTRYSWRTPTATNIVVEGEYEHTREASLNAIIRNTNTETFESASVTFEVTPWVGECVGQNFFVEVEVVPSVSMSFIDPVTSTCPGSEDVDYTVEIGHTMSVGGQKVRWEFYGDTTIYDYNDVRSSHNIDVPYICDTSYIVKATYYDDAQCFASDSITISAVDEEAPTLTGTWPADITGQNNCFANADRSVFISDADVKALFEDNCTGDITVTHDDTDNPTDDCGWTITRTYTIKDACNNIYYTDGSSTLPFQKLSGSDQTKPTYTRPGDTVLYVSCAAVSSSDTTVTALGKPTGVSDNCSAETSITVSHRDSIVAVCGHAEKIYRIWRVKDACGNVSASDSVQFINVIDTVQLTATADTTQKICITKTVQTITFGGNGTLSVSPALPAGLTFDATARTISGTPENSDTIRYVVRATNGCSDYDKTISGTIIVTPPIKLNAIIDSAECGNSNGTIMAFATGGTLPYTFKINGTGATETGIFNRLSEGSYTISVTDADNCPFTPEGGLVAVVQQLDVQDIKGVTRYGQLTDYDPDGNMIDRYGKLDTVPHLNQYGAVIPHDRTMSNLTATSTAGSHAIVVSVSVDKKANAHTLEFQYSTDGTNFTLYGSKKITNLTNGTTYSHTFPNVTAGTYNVRAILRTCHEETVTEMVTVVVQ